jgi:hypothetical protein
VIGVDIADPNSHLRSPTTGACAAPAMAGDHDPRGRGGPVDEARASSCSGATASATAATAYDRAMGMLRERAFEVADVEPQHQRRVRLGRVPLIFDQLHRNRVRYAISTDGPRCSDLHPRELATLGRLGILDIDQQQRP